MSLFASSSVLHARSCARSAFDTDAAIASAPIAPAAAADAAVIVDLLFLEHLAALCEYARLQLDELRNRREDLLEHAQGDLPALALADGVEGLLLPLLPLLTILLLPLLMLLPLLPLLL